MELTKSEELTDYINKLITNNWENKIRTDVALTDLLSPRRAFFQRKFPEAPTTKEVLYFLSGKSIEKGLGDLIGLDHPIARKVDGIFYNPDFRFPDPTELKSRRANLPKEGEELERFNSYVEQLFGYCALDDVDEGNLIVFALSEKMDDSRKTIPMLVAYKFKCDAKEREIYRRQLNNTKDLFLEALETDDISKLPLCPQYFCYKVITNMIEKPKCLTCDREFSNDYYLSKHLNGAKTSDHKGVYSKKEYTIQKECKYYDRCNPRGETL